MAGTYKTHIGLRGLAGGAMRNAWSVGGSGLSPRNRFPAFPVSGVKKPAPVAVGTEALM